MTTTNHLNLTHIRANQAQKEVTLNEALNVIDAVLNTGAIDRGLDTPPVSPAEGDVYIVGGSPSGDWASNAADIAYYQDGAWSFIVPNEGMTLWVNDEDTLYTWDGASWITSGLDSLNDLTDVSISGAATYDLLQHNGTAFVNTQNVDNIGRVGVATTADATNKLAVASDAVLFTAGASGDVQIKVNKSTSADTASYVFQDNYSGRAEFGLVGDDDFQVKVSPNGSTFYQSFVVDRNTGNIDFKKDVSITGALAGVDLNDLGDTTITTPANGQILKFNGSAWVNDTVSGASSSLSALDDASITGAADNDFLVYNGTDWVNEVPATARGSMGLGTIATQNANAVTISGGAVDGTTLGATTASSASVTTLSASSTISCNDNLLTRPEIKDYAETRASNSSASGSVTVNFENGNLHELTLTGNITTLTLSNPPASGKAGNLTLILKQDGTGGRTVSWPAAVKWAGGSAPTLSTGASAVDMVMLVTTDAGTTYYAGVLVGFV